jgi:hypothetical protein
MSCASVRHNGISLCRGSDAQDPAIRMPWVVRQMNPRSPIPVQDRQYPGARQDCSRIGHCRAKPVFPAVQQDCPEGNILPGFFLYLFWLVTNLKTADKRMRIPPGRPETMIASAVPRLFRSGRCSPCAFSARADAVRTRESTPMMIVKAARSFLCVFIRYILFTNVNSHYWMGIGFNPSIPTKIAPCYQKSTE